MLRISNYFLQKTSSGGLVACRLNPTTRLLADMMVASLRIVQPWCCILHREFKQGHPFSFVLTNK